MLKQRPAVVRCRAVGGGMSSASQWTASRLRQPFRSCIAVQPSDADGAAEGGPAAAGGVMGLFRRQGVQQAYTDISAVSEVASTSQSGPVSLGSADPGSSSSAYALQPPQTEHIERELSSELPPLRRRWVSCKMASRFCGRHARNV